MAARFVFHIPLPGRVRRVRVAVLLAKREGVRLVDYPGIGLVKSVCGYEVYNTLDQDSDCITRSMKTLSSVDIEHVK